MRGWMKYFKELLNSNKENTCQVERHPHQLQQRNQIVHKPAQEKIIAIIMQLKNNRAPDEDHITAEMLKYGRAQRNGETH